MKKPNPSDTTSTGIEAAWARRMNGTKPGSWGCAAAVAKSSSDSVSNSSSSHTIWLREPILPAS